MPALLTTPGLHSRARRAGYDPDALEAACVLIVGAGALGQNVAQDLALSGVRELRLVDGDTFEGHNRTRSPLHPRRGEYSLDETLPKATRVARELARIHVDDESVILAADTWIEELGLAAFEGVDAVAACADALTARAYLARVAMQLNLPIVEGGFSGPNLGMTVYPSSEDPAIAPCWSCGGAAAPGAFSCQAYAEYAQEAGVIPAIQTGAAALGAMCAEAVVALLHGAESEPRHVSLDLRTGESRISRPRPDPVCASGHRRLAPPTATAITPGMTVREAISTLGDPNAAVFLPDVYVERANCPTCKTTCWVGAPSHRWQRDPRCSSCQGPWPRSEEQIPSPDTVDMWLDADDPRSDLTLESFGFRPGDIVELEGARIAAARLAGDPQDLFTEIRPREVR